MWNAAKAVLKEIFIAMNTYTIKKENYRLNDHSFHLMKLEKEYTTPRLRTNKIIKPRVEINELENRKTIEKSVM